MKNNLKRFLATLLTMAMFVSNFTGLSFAADNMATIEFRNCGHGQIVGPERIEVATGSAIKVSDAYVTTFWSGNTDPAAFLYWVLSDPNGHWLHVEGEDFIPTEAKLYTFDLVPMYGRFKVRYEANGATGGTVPASSMTYGDNSSNELLTVAGNVKGLTKDGYDFNGWNTSPDGSGKAYSAGDSIGIVAAPQYVTHLYAMWTPKPKYTVTYTCDATQASISKTNDEVTQGGSLVLPQITANRGWRLLGWCSDDGMIEKMPGDTIIVTSNLTLKAVLVPANKLALKYDANGASEGTAPTDSNIYYSGDNVVVKGNEGNLIKTSFGFKGWNTNADGTGISYAAGAQIPINGNATLYAQWTPQYTVTYVIDAEKGTLAKASDTAAEGTDVTLPVVTEKRGWHFVNWRTADGLVEKAAGAAYTVAQNITFNAVFEATPQIAISYNANGAEKGTVPTDNNVYFNNDKVMIASNTGNLSKTGFTFDGWNTIADGSGVDYKVGQSMTAGQNMILFAKWKVSEPVNNNGNSGTSNNNSGTSNNNGGTSNNNSGSSNSSNSGNPSNTSSKGDRDRDTSTPVSKPTPPAPVVKVIPKEETPLGKLNAEDHFAYMSGYPDKTFRPNGSITRAEIAMILFRLLNDPSKNNYAPSKSSFKDVKTNAWYGKAVLYLCNMGVLKGDGKGKFNPNAPISRAELATVISKFYALESIDSTPLTDIKGHWAEAYIRSAYAKHWINAYADGTYKPNANMTRVDTLKLINNALDRKVDKAHIPMTEIARFTDVSENNPNFEGIVETTNTHLYQLESGVEVWNSLTDKQDLASK